MFQIAMIPSPTKHHVIRNTTKRRCIHNILLPIAITNALLLSTTTSLTNNGHQKRCYYRFSFVKSTARKNCISGVSPNNFYPSQHKSSSFPKAVGSTLLFGASADDDVSSDNRSVETTTTESLADQLSALNFRNVVAVVGAGASVSAGIPDFRSPGTGLYHKLEKYNLPYPEAIFDLNYYRTINPMPFVDLCQSIWPGQETGPKPTIAHKFLKLLQDKGCLRRIYTQNIDGLEALAGVYTENLVECHGNFRNSSCIKCDEPVDSIVCRETMFRGSVPTCPSCGSYVKPDIVFFGEELPGRFQQLIERDLYDCDLLLVLGTSLMVNPVAEIPTWVRKDCSRMLLNRELVGDFYSSNNVNRDAFMKGDCDDSVRRLCQLAGWDKDLEQL
mmetsp:Transcript_18116/g.20900  ORF Transcript_18116/g.20900 Transcript_18116/m.20900 type:complete len:387 (+) Transcript_18116:101-1261(+)